METAMTARGSIAAIAGRLLEDGDVPIAERVYAVQIVHRLRLGGRVTLREEWRIRSLYARRQREVREAARRWSVC